MLSNSCTCTHPRTIEFYYIEYRDPFSPGSRDRRPLVSLLTLSPHFLVLSRSRLHYIIIIRAIYIQCTNHEEVSFQFFLSSLETRSLAHTHARTPLLFVPLEPMRIDPRGEIERFKSQVSTKSEITRAAVRFEELENNPSHLIPSTCKKSLRLPSKSLEFPISSSNVYTYIYIYIFINNRRRENESRDDSTSGKRGLSIGSLDVPRSCGSQLLHAG